MRQLEKVNIRPQVTVLSVLKYLEYETWYALAEFVDNSIGSFLKYQSELKSVEGEGFKLEINIEIDETENRITIRDNAAGIHQQDYYRAFRTAETPPDTTGLSEFGMGMKSAACWFSDQWKVRTTALGESVEKTICFDMKEILANKVEELEIKIDDTNPNHHYTIIELNNVNKLPRRRGLAKVKEHLKSIYRDFIRKGLLVLKIDSEVVFYEEPKVLKAAKFDDPNGEEIIWKREISFPVDEGLSVKGFVAIREKASTAEAGFALFRKGRVVEGSYDTGFRPEYIFGNPNSFRYQRVFGELHLEGFEVIFTKKGIKWDENLDVFLTCLRDELTHETFPLLQQAERYRVRATEKEFKDTKKALDDTVKDFKATAPQAIREVIETPKAVEPDNVALATIEKSFKNEFEVRFNRMTWLISIELSYDPSLKDLMEIGNHLISERTSETSVRQIGIRLSLTHPFMVEFAGVDNSRIEPILRVIAALGLSEVIAKESGARTQGEVRRNFNELITKLTKKS